MQLTEIPINKQVQEKFKGWQPGSGSGDMSSQLIDDFGQPICRMMTRSMSRS